MTRHYSCPINGEEVLSHADVVGRLRAAGCVFAEAEADLICDSATAPEERAALVERRASGEPLEYVLGWAHFHGIRVQVDPGVFVPRHRSDLLVEHAITLTKPGSVVVDLCCGTGALGLAVARAIPDIALYATDLDPDAVACARRNVEPAGGTVVEGDLFDALPEDLRGRVDTLIVNAPYVPTDAIRLMPIEARLHEHSIALDGGVDGLDVHRRLAAQALEWLSVEGRLLVEASEEQADVLVTEYARYRMRAIVHQDDDAGGVVVMGSRS